MVMVGLLVLTNFRGVLDLDCRDVAWRIHGFMSHTVEANRFLTPMMVRFVGGVLATASLVSAVFGYPSEGSVAEHR